MKLVNILLLMSLITGCAKVRTINTRPQKFGVKPLKIIWMQVGGLDEQHIAMIRFGRDGTSNITSFENSLCMGKAWSYDLFHLRTEQEHGFLGQLVGKKSIEGSCSDFSNRPLWSYLDKLGFSTGVFETNFNKSIIDRSLSCGDEASDFLKNLYVWKMQKAPKKGTHKFYHHLEDKQFEASGVYYDKSCQGDICYSGISAGVKGIYQNFTRSRGKTVFIFRDGTYANAINNREYGKAREKLVELEKLYGDFLEIAKRDGNTLLLFTSSAARNLELPRKGKEWKQFDKKGKNITYRNNSLLSPVFAYGARAENFCGVYEEADILKRILWTPEVTQIEMDVRELVK